MVELPTDFEGLSWIVSQEPLQLLLIPGLQPASITAAAAGDAVALFYLRFAAQYSAAHRSMLNPDELDKCCLLASELHPRDGSDANFDLETELTLRSSSSCEVRKAFFRRQKFTAELLKKAVCEGQLAALQWIRALCHQIHGNDRELMELAAGQGSLEIMKFLRSGPRPAPWGKEVAKAAIQNPPCLQWLLAQPEPCPCADDIVEHAARSGSLEALKVLYAAKLPAHMWGPKVCSKAARHPNGKIVLEWLRAQRPVIPWDEGTCVSAARVGNLALLKWMRAQDVPCPWDTMCTAAAAYTGNLSMLQWLRSESEPCPLNEDCTLAAVMGGSLTALQWLRAQHSPCPVHESCLEQAVSRGDLPMLQWLCSQGCQMQGTLYVWAANGHHSHILQWLHQQGLSARHVLLPLILDMNTLSIPLLLFLGDIGAKLGNRGNKSLIRARQTLCTFHGLLCWCRRAVSDPSKGMHRAFDNLSDQVSGQSLLVRLSRLPPVLIDRIAVAAELQHDLLS